MEVRVLTERFDQPDAWTLDGYERTGGYAAARTALEMDPDDIIDVVKDSGLRGRGGAGFPTGVKWSFMPKEPTQPSYAVCNADESEPGTYKDRWLLERDPHQLVDGLICMSLALRSEHAFVYIRGEYEFPARRLANAIGEAYEAGYLGDRIFGSDRRLHVTMHRGAGAYECGEETALLDSLEGRRGQPRLRPPFPAQRGLYAAPTTVNNVETICNVPHIIVRGPEWYRAMGTEKSPGPKLVCVSGEVRLPGNFEVSMDTPVREVIDDLCGGMNEDRPVKFWIPGGSSTPMLPGEALDGTLLSFESIQEAGSLLGTAALMVFSDRTCTVDAALNWTRFYEHESCGKCTPCREGTYWLSQVLARIESGRGRMADIGIIEDVCEQMFGRSFCAFGDGAAQPPLTAIRHFRDEWVAHVEEQRCPLGAKPPADRPTLVAHAVDDEGRIGAPRGPGLPLYRQSSEAGMP